MIQEDNNISQADFLLEIGTEELPAKSLQELVADLAFNVEQGLQNAELSYGRAVAYASPRRLAVLIRDLADKQKDHVVEKRGPAFSAAFNEDGAPTQACIGFATSCGVTVSELQKHKTSAGTWVMCRKPQSGAKTINLMCGIVEDAVNKLSLPKAMRWGNADETFVRPVHWIVMLYADQIIKAKILGIEAGSITYGHRFHHPDPIEITHASQYAEILSTTGFVIVDIEQRKEMIRSQLSELAGQRGTVVIDEDLLNEVTGMVEYPVALLCAFNTKFLNMPLEILKAVMRNHQRYFYLVDEKGGLLPYFVALSNIKSKDEKRVISGNERVMRARLNDAEFFYHVDLQKPLSDYVDRLKDVVYQSKLGSLYDKTKRMEKLAVFISKEIGADATLAERAAFLSKADLMTSVVREIPELQGVMGYYYALHQQEPQVVAAAVRDHYLPRYSGDALPGNDIALVVALADRIDHLVGIFSMGQVPTGDKDPFALRRAALAIVRILIEKQVDLDLKKLIEFACSTYNFEFPKTFVLQVLDFIFERLRSWYAEQGIESNIVHAVLARYPTSLVDFNRRVQAVRIFEAEPQAGALIAAHKRVNNILKKIGLLLPEGFNLDLCTEDAERQLASEIKEARNLIAPLYEEGFYTEALKVLAELKVVIDNFFDNVMVMVADEKIRNNRLILLHELRDLFCYVADISLLAK